MVWGSSTERCAKGEMADAVWLVTNTSKIALSGCAETLRGIYGAVCESMAMRKFSQRTEKLSTNRASPVSSTLAGWDGCFPSCSSALEQRRKRIPKQSNHPITPSSSRPVKSPNPNRAHDALFFGSPQDQSPSGTSRTSSTLCTVE